MSNHQAKIGLLLLASASFTGTVAAGTVTHYPATATGVACWELGALSQFLSAKNPAELLADNPLTCKLQAPGSGQDWAWAGPCTGCKRLAGAVELIPDGSFQDPTESWVETTPGGTKVYTVGLEMHFTEGTRMVKLWIAGASVRRKDGKPLPINSGKSP